MIRPTLTPITVTSTEVGVTQRDLPEEVMAEAVEVTMMAQASAEMEDSGLEELREDAEVSGAAEVAILEGVSVEARATVLVVAVDLEEEADLVVAASVAEEALVWTRSVEGVLAEIAIILGTTMDLELSEAVADLGALVTTNLVAEEMLLGAMMGRVRRSSSR